MQMVWIQFNSWLKMIKNGPQSTLLIKKSLTITGGKSMLLILFLKMIWNSHKTFIEVDKLLTIMH